MARGARERLESERESERVQGRERRSESDVGYDRITEDLVWDLRQNGAQVRPTYTAVSTLMAPFLTSLSLRSL